MSNFNGVNGLNGKIHFGCREMETAAVRDTVF